MPDFGTILLVDDDPTQIAILTAYFRGIGSDNILSAGDPIIGLEKLRDHLCDVGLVVSDLQMPNMDGLEFLRYMKELGYRGQLAIFSGVDASLLNHAGRLAEMHKLNIIGQLSKPLNKAELDEMFVSEKPGGRVKSSSSVETANLGEAICKDEFVRALQNGRIRPFYQPKVDVKKYKVVGAESLARWIHEDGTQTLPKNFIDFAENNSLISTLTITLYQQVLNDTKLFLEVDPDLKMAVNLSPEMLGDVSLPDRLQKMADQAGLSSANLSFEVTETQILDLDSATLEVLSRLRIHGFEVAIDDFGTGSSNIQALRDFPYSELKVDRAFVSRSHENEFSAETVMAAVAFAKQMNMKTVAEGVENLEEWKFVAKAGIDEVQGFLISKPLDAHSFLGFLRANQKSDLSCSSTNAA